MINLDFISFLGSYAQSAAIFAIFFGFAILYLFVISKILKKLVSKSKTKLDDLLIEKTTKPITYLILAIGALVSTKYIPLATTQQTLENIFISLIYLFSGFVLIRIIDIIIEAKVRSFLRKTKSKMGDTLLPLAQATVKIIVLVFVLIFILGQWGVNITPLLAGIGIAGIAISFALKDSLANIFGGISLIADKAIQVGDFIKVGSVTGQVTEISLRSTRIKTWDNELVTVPNGKMASENLQNYDQPNDYIRVVVPFSVAYGSDTDKVKKIVLDTIKKVPNVIKNKEEMKPDVIFTEMGDSSLNFLARFWVDSFLKRYNANLEATDKIHKALIKNKINIPFPTQTLHIKK